MSSQDLDAIIDRAFPVWLIGDAEPDEIGLKLLDEFSIWPWKKYDKDEPRKIFPWVLDDSEIINYIARNVKSGSVYRLDDDDLLRAAGFTHHLTVDDPTTMPDEDFQNAWLVTLDTTTPVVAR